MSTIERKPIVKRTEEEVLKLVEEGYEIITEYTTRLYNKDKYFSLKETHSLEDVISYVFFNYYKKDRYGYNMFEKFNPEVTSFKYHIARSIETKFIDLLRKQRSGEKKSELHLEDKIGEDLTLGDTVLAEDGRPSAQELLESEYERNLILKMLPNEDNHMVGNSPILGKCCMTLRVLALHLEYGFKPEEIGNMFSYKNRNISPSTVNKYIKELRVYVKENIL